MKRFFLLILVLFSMAALYLVTRVELISLGYRRTKAILMERRLDEENKKLKSRVERLKSPERLRKVGKELGLCPPREDQIVFVGK